MKAIILDDAYNSYHLLTHLLESCSVKVEIIGSACSLEEGKQLIKILQPDLVFVNLGKDEEILWFELFDSDEIGDIPIVVLADDPQYALNAIHLGMLDYLLKPLEKEEVEHMLQKASRELEKKKKRENSYRLVLDVLQKMQGSQLASRISISTADGIFLKELSDIVRMEAKEGYTNIIFTEGQKEILASINLGEYESRFKKYPEFMRVHRSHLVNLNYVDRYIRSDGGYLMLKNGNKVQVSRNYKDSLMVQLTKW